MALMNWDTLIAPKTVDGSIKRWLNYDKVDPEEVIAEAEDWMALNLRTMHMQNRVDVTVTPGMDSFILDEFLPRFLDPISVFLMGHYYLGYRAVDDLDHIRLPHEDGSQDEGPPRWFALSGHSGGRMLFDVASDGDYKLMVNYYQRPEPLSPTQQTNIYTERYRKIFKETLLACAYQSPKDSVQENEHFGKAEGLIQRLKANDDIKLRALEHPVWVS